MSARLKTYMGSLGNSQGKRKRKKKGEKNKEERKRKESESVKLGTRWIPQGGCVLIFELFESYPQ